MSLPLPKKGQISATKSLWMDLGAPGILKHPVGIPCFKTDLIPFASSRTPALTPMIRGCASLLPFAKASSPLSEAVLPQALPCVLQQLSAFPPFDCQLVDRLCRAPGGSAAQQHKVSGIQPKGVQQEQQAQSLALQDGGNPDSLEEQGCCAYRKGVSRVSASPRALPQTPKSHLQNLLFTLPAMRYQ